jgi:hypothetical protein
MEFKELAKSIRNQFTEIQKTDKLFKSNLETQILLNIIVI